MPQLNSLKINRATVEKWLTQAKDSVRLLEPYMKLPTRAQAEQLTREKLNRSLKKLGLATRTEVEDLERKVEGLASELRGQISTVTKAVRKNSAKPEHGASNGID